MAQDNIAQSHRNDGSDDSKIDARISILLRVGTMASAAVILLGGISFLINRGQSIPDYKVFQGTPAGLNTFKAISFGALHGDDLAMIQFGLLMLIATPVARVVFSVFGFLGERDYLYIVISSIVLGVLLYGLIWH